jgi:hypothetical protein
MELTISPNVLPLEAFILGGVYGGSEIRKC